jgi:hypothetical protein
VLNNSMYPIAEIRDASRSTVGDDCCFKVSRNVDVGSFTLSQRSSVA